MNYFTTMAIKNVTADLVPETTESYAEQLAVVGRLESVRSRTMQLLRDVSNAATKADADAIIAAVSSEFARVICEQTNYLRDFIDDERDARAPYWG